jgi:hypothetical protein
MAFLGGDRPGILTIAIAFWQRLALSENRGGFVKDRRS